MQSLPKVSFTLPPGDMDVSIFGHTRTAARTLIINPFIVMRNVKSVVKPFRFCCYFLLFFVVVVVVVVCLCVCVCVRACVRACVSAYERISIKTQS